MFPVVLLGRPVINDAYRDRLVSLGLDPATKDLNPPPAPDSVIAECRICHAPIWLGPNQQAALTEVLTTDDEEISVRVECLLCGYLYTMPEADRVEFVSLSDD
ncbi:hypothetical protein [Actinomadura sp. 9N215]|uniref:hypothetical protein n=1 Tax=Actinomadura sp. 9N215 TaxID=3375150 RepID=UPI0037B1C5FD